MALNGLNMSDFNNHKEALATADDLIAENQKDFEHKEDPVIHTNPLLSKFFYVHGQGKKRTHSQAESKTFGGAADVKTQKQLADSKAFAEGIGIGNTGSSSSSVKVENLAYSKMVQQKDTLRSHGISVLYLLL